MTKPTRPVSRRQLLAAGGAAGLASLAATTTARAQGTQSAATAASGTVSVAKNAQYETVPLRKETIAVSAIQSRLKSVDVRDLARTMRANVARVCRLIDLANNQPEEWHEDNTWGTRQDLVAMHEFPIQGFQPWTRKELNKIALDLPGPETEAIGERAKRYGCYVAFGCYARVKDWPGHVVNMSVIIGPTGEIVDTQWKSRNIFQLFPGDTGLLGTTIYDVLDRYVEMYGVDRVIPVARTDIGNLAMTAVGNESMLYQALALKGTEILILTVTGGNNADSAIETARSNRIYTLGIGNSVSPDNLGFPEASGSEDEGTVIVDPSGRPLARSANHHEDIVQSVIPIGAFRKTRRFRDLPMALFLPVFQQYVPRIRPNAFLESLPETYKESGALFKKRLEGK